MREPEKGGKNEPPTPASREVAADYIQNVAVKYSFPKIGDALAGYRRVLKRLGRYLMTHNPTIHSMFDMISPTNKAPVNMTQAIKDSLKNKYDEAYEEMMTITTKMVLDKKNNRFLPVESDYEEEDKLN
jgi:hypothetical protein